MMPATRQDQLIKQANESFFADPQDLREMMVPPQKRPRGARQVPTVESVLNLDRYLPTRRSWVSGASSDPVDRTSMIDEGWGGSSRYSMRSLG